MADSQGLSEASGDTALQRSAKAAAALAMRLKRYWPWAVGALVIAALAWGAFGRGKPAEPYRMAAIDRGTITQVVSATGALTPLVSVSVGSTVSGLVKAVNADFNSPVRAGQVLARLDPATFQQRVAQAQATLAQAQAQYGVASADYARYQRLRQAGFASDQLIGQQRAARDSAAAGVAQARAALASAQIDLDHSIIRSPINGVVVDRQINVGQSVAASFQAPTLFVIAQDLSRLQANIAVDEADIGEVREGLPVRFTVDAFPDSEFEGRVAQVRQQGAQSSGVVSYTVVVEADNPRHQLLPGMTANAEIIIHETENALRLPNAALRFRPSDPALAARAQALITQAGSAPSAQSGDGANGGNGAARGLARVTEALQLTPAQQAQARSAFEQAAANAGPRPDANAAPTERRAYFRRIRDAAIRQIEPSLSAHQRDLLQAMRSAPADQREQPARQAAVWVLRNGKLEPVRVEIGVADDSFTELLGGDLRAGDQVVTGGGPQTTGQGSRSQGGATPAGGLGGAGVRIRGA